MRRPSCVKARVVGSSVWKSRSPTPTPAPVSALSSVDLPAFVYPASATVGSAARSRSARITARFRSRRSSRRRSAVIRSRARRRSVSIWDSPGPLVPIPASEPLEVRPEPPHAGEVVLELRQLDLELPLGRVGVVGEDVEDHRGPVDHRNAQLLLQVPLLARRELVVEGDQVGVGGGDLPLQLGELSPAQVAVRVGLGAGLGHLPRRRHPGGAQQLLQLGERILSVLVVADDPDRDGALAGARVDDAGGAVYVVALGLPPVAVSLHSLDVRRRSGCRSRAAEPSEAERRRR